MARFFVALLLLPACRMATARDLESRGFRADLSQQLQRTLELQRHYFRDDKEALEFAEKLRQVADSATDATSYYQGVARTLATLGEGHTGLVSSAEVPFASTIPPVALLEIDGQPMVAGVAPGVEGGGLRPGDIIVTVDGLPAGRVLSRQLELTAGSTEHGRRARAVANLLAGPTNVPARVRVRGVDRRERICYPLRFLLDDEGENRFRFGFMSAGVTSARVTVDAGYIALPDFREERVAEFEQHLRPMLGLPVLLIDLRGNPGGRIRTLQRLAGFFLRRSETLLQLHEGGRIEPVVAEPGPLRYDGELRILVDERTGSAAELLAAALQDLSRARVYGRETAGSTRSRKTSILPGGVVFHYAGRAEFRRVDGSVIEGRGVKPDVALLRSRDSLGRNAYGAPERDPAVRLAVGSN